jgi:hypothetical protein
MKVSKEKQIKRLYQLTSFDNLKLNYQKIPKCATTSMLKILIEADKRKSVPENLVHNEHQVKYITLKEANTNGYKTFTIVRNPIDRAVSMYIDHFFKRKNLGVGGSKDFVSEITKLKSNPDFSTFLDILSRYPDEDKDAHFKSQNYYCKANNLIILKLEEVKDTISQIHPRLTFNIKLHTTNSKNLTVSTENILSIMHTFSTDFEIYNG